MATETVAGVMAMLVKVTAGGGGVAPPPPPQPASASAMAIEAMNGRMDNNFLKIDFMVISPVECVMRWLRHPWEMVFKLEIILISGE